MRKIVVIDPSETFVKFLNRVISGMGFEVFCAGDGESGLAMVRNEKPDMVVSELNVPPRGGLCICGEITGSPETGGIPVVFVTTDGSAESEKRAREAGCSDFLTKPVNIRVIHDMLQRNLPFVDKRRALRIRASLDVVIRVGDRMVVAETETLGEGGMLVRTSSDLLQVSSQVVIYLSLNTADPPVRLTGEVIYVMDSPAPCASGGIGIKYVDIEPDAAARINRFINGAIT